MLSFLEKVWPDNGYYLVAHPASTGYFHKSFASKSEAYAQALKWSEAGDNVYFAVASVDGLGDYAKRACNNTVSVRSLWFDLDCGEDKAAKGHGYANQTDALKHLRAFVEALSLPVPTIVNSGYGWHCYFILTEDVAPQQWKAVAEKLKSCAKHFGLIADPSRTADQTSVLRVPSTNNYKRESPAPVYVAKEGQTASVESIDDALTAYIEYNGLRVKEVAVKVEPVPTELLNVLDANGVEPLEPVREHKPCDFNRIVESCAAMRYAVEHNADLVEPQWMRALSVAKYCTDPHDAMLRVSQDHRDFSEESMLAKAEPRNGAISCTDFTENFKQCAGCPHSIPNPLHLGYAPKVIDEDTGLSSTITVASAEPSTDEETDWDFADGFKGEFYPDGYSLTRAGIKRAAVGDDGHATIVCPYPLKFTGRRVDLHNPTKREFTMGFSLKLPHDGWTDFTIAARELGDSKGGKIAAELAANSCVLSAQEQKYIGEFMSAYIRSVVAAAAASKSHGQLGWSKDLSEFVMPTFAIKSDGTQVECGMSSKVTGISKHINKAGTLEEWLSVIDVYSRNGYEGYAFGHSVGYGALLLSFVDNYAGAIVNMVGDSGSGKSTVLQSINTLFGPPDALMMRQGDTPMSRFQRIGVLNSVCPTCDELSNISPEEASSLCYSISAGKERGRMNQDGSAKEHQATWKTIMASTSNRSLYEILGSAKADAKAESMRVFEYHVRTDAHSVNKRDAESVFGKLHRNYGHAGEIFVRWVAQNQGAVADKVRHWTHKFDDATEAENCERYWSSIVGTTIAGAEIAKSLGLNNFDIDAVFNFAVAQVTHIRSTISDNVQTPMNLLVHFMNQSVRSTLVVEGGYMAKDGHRKFVSVQEPNNRLTVRLELDNDRCYIDKRALRDFIVEGGSDYNQLRGSMMNAKILLNDNAKCVLSEGSSAIRTGPATCWLLDMSHPEMSAGAQLTVVKRAVDTPKIGVVQ